MGYVKDLQDGFFAALARRMAEHGFESRPRDQSFTRKTPVGRQTFHVSFIKHANGCDVTADVAVRIDRLEDLLNEWNGTLSKSERKQTHSMGAELGNISEGRQRRWTLAGEDNIPEAVSSTMALFESVGLPYLQKYSDLEQALAALSGDDRPSWLHSPFHDLRAQRAIGLAFVLGRHERMDELIAAKTRFLRERNDPGLDRFLAFAKDIKGRAATENSIP
jgi:hypothetical protein